MAGNQVSNQVSNQVGSAAERLRSLLVATESLTVHTPGHQADLAGRHRVDTDGRVNVELPERSCLARRLVQDGEVVAMVELTDLAPVAVRDRVRARATLTGWLVAGGDPVGGERWVALDLATAEVVEAGVTRQVDPEEFRAARPDPLAATEAELLCHLSDRHPRLVDVLARLVPVAHLHGVRRIHPVRLDRYGVVLRLESADRDRDVRLPFHQVLDRPAQVESRMRRLLSEAGRCRRLIGR